MTIANTAEAWPRIPGYTILKVAGEGGMGVVFQAEEIESHRSVAIKVLTPQRQDAFTTGTKFDPLESFKREAKIIASLEHPYILPVYDYGEYEGQPFLVMRYLDGGSIADRIEKSGPVPFKQAAQWIANVADALDYAHHKGIIHKDVKPSNMLLDESGNVYLTDFGIAGVTGGEGKSGIGSAAYMPPEQSMGNTVDGRADLYALAVSLFEMLAGEKPYQAETAMGVIVRHMHDPIPVPHLMNPEITHSVSTLIQWGMAKDPANRPSSPAEFSNLLSFAASNPEVSLRSMPELKKAATDPQIKLDRKLIEETATGLKPPTVDFDPTVVMSEKEITGVLSVGKKRSPLLIGGIVTTLVVVVLGICFFAIRGSLAIAFVSPTPLPTATKLPTPTPQPTSTPTPEGRILVDDFSSNTSGFATITDEDGGVSYVNGQLLFEARRPLQWFSPSGEVDVRDVTIEVDAEQLSGAEAVDMGIICRWQGLDNYTALTTSREGLVTIWQLQEGERTVLAEEDVAALAVDTGTVQRLRAVCAGETLQLFVDDALVVTATDPNPISGDIALLTRLRTSDEDMVVAFDNIEVTQ